MKKLFIKYEKKINNLLIKLTDKIYFSILKFIPPKWIQYKRKKQQEFRDFINWLKEWIKNTAIKIKDVYLIPIITFKYGEFIAQKKEAFFGKLSAFKERISTKEYWKDKLKKLKELLLEAKEKILRFNFLFFLKIVSIITVVTLIGYFIYNQILNYVENMNAEKEYVYQQREVGDGHPVYYKRDKKSMTFYQLYLPVYTENNFVTTVQCTFTVQVSNRYIINYFRAFEDNIRDQVISELHLMDVKFLLTDEGKIVLRQKVKDELNRYLKKKNIRGSVEQVYVHEILAD